VIGAPGVIEGSRVRLRPVNAADLDQVMDWINDPSVTQFLAVGRVPVTRDEEQKWLSERPANERRMTVESLSGEYLGAAGLHAIDFIDRNAELGMVISSEKNWGKGYGRETLHLLVEFAFQSLSLHRLYLRVYAHNDRALHLYERAGFSQEGVDREAHFHGGRWHDVIRMGLLATDQRPLPPAGR
jgi:RimJ/RimL family protein N-acetyltransferase